ncbi:hypothetical protein LTR28_009646 [Elasticomyces elasticus]|nr:hypothetical protein LTR28_009646 [Elasticomyces elasticus]
MSTYDPMADPPELTILLLGDAEVGKSTYLSRLTLGSHPTTTDLPTLHDLDQPFIFDIKMYNRAYRFSFHDTSTPSTYTLLRPDVIILCYSIASRPSLHSLRTHWNPLISTHFSPASDSIPVITLGLKRDLRREDDPAVVWPQEGVRVAQEMRCDRYCECSARTGELCREVFEDVAKTAAMTTTREGGRTAPPPCVVQ